MRNSSEARAWVLALTPVAIIAMLLVAMFVWLERNQVPEPLATPFNGSTVEPGTGEVLIPRPEPTLIPVEPIVTEPDPPLLEDLRTDDVLADRTLLGIRNGYAVYGVLTGSAQVCIVVRSDEGAGGGPTYCTDWATFSENGMTYDQGDWGIHWDPDGTVEWQEQAP